MPYRSLLSLLPRTTNSKVQVSRTESNRSVPALSLRLVGAFVLAVGGCDCAADDPSGPIACDSDNPCESGSVCIDQLCIPADASIDGNNLFCSADETACGSSCCSSDELCDSNSCVTDCGAKVRCGTQCCADGLVCESGACVGNCSQEDRCGVNSELCCSTNEACLSDACVALGAACTVTEECAIEEICLNTLGRCAPRSEVEVCEFRPPVGEFSPQIACRWDPPAAFSEFDDVVMTPAVMNLTDDNDDGVTDTNDIPDIVFVAFRRQEDDFRSANSRVVIASGLCNDDGSMETIAFLDSPSVGNSTGVALGNLHPSDMTEERNPEIVVTSRNGTVYALRRLEDDGSSWEEMWFTTESAIGEVRDSLDGRQPAIADVNGDGAPEVIVGNVVYEGLTGHVVWNGASTVGLAAGVGWNGFLGPVSTVADIDLNGTMEVIAGNTVYEGATGDEVWTFDYGSETLGGTCRNQCDGFAAVGDFDDDPEAEIVIVRQGELFLLEHTSEQIERVLLPQLDPDADPADIENEGGPPTIADFDGDGRPEVGTAGSDFYVVIDFDCKGDPLPSECHDTNILWQVENDDDSSRVTGSSVFDFEGDGMAEVIYADETSFRIFDGSTGAVLFVDTTHRSNTRLEMPIVVDVDNDGKSEVVIPEPNDDDTEEELGGIEIWEDADNNWVRTRRVWNQHTYHVTNIDEDGQVPSYEEPNWTNSRLNNFRQNVQPAGLFDAPDLQIEAISVVRCSSNGRVTIQITVTNQGALGVAAGVPVFVRAVTSDGMSIDIGAAMTERALLPSQNEAITIEYEFDPFDFDTYEIHASVDDDGDGGSTYNECIEDNNDRTGGPFEACGGVQ